MVLTEAFASGTPVVCSDIAGYRDVVRDGIEGALVPPGDPVALGEALLDLAGDPERRAAMRGHARERAERFAWPHVAGELVSAYEEAPADAGAVVGYAAAGGAYRCAQRRPRAARSRSPDSIARAGRPGRGAPQRLPRRPGAPP